MAETENKETKRRLKKSVRAANRPEQPGYVATTKFLIASPTKVRPVANVIRSKSTTEALAILDV
ncbi:MAG: hypothetical protein IKN90_08575, partial [Treponema sp.]|nr:hypothetical protein [Treponema sp.]